MEGLLRPSLHGSGCEHFGRLRVRSSSVCLWTARGTWVGPSRSACARVARARPCIYRALPRVRSADMRNAQSRANRTPQHCLVLYKEAQRASPTHLRCIVLPATAMQRLWRCCTDWVQTSMLRTRMVTHPCNSQSLTVSWCGVLRYCLSGIPRAPRVLEGFLYPRAFRARGAWL